MTNTTPAAAGTTPSTTPTISLSHSFVIVDDQDKALTFYRDLVGLTVHTDATMDGFRWVSLIAPGSPGVEIVLLPGGTFSDTMSSADAQSLSTLLAKGHLAGLIFATDDVDTTFETLRAGGAEVLEEPTDQPYGVRDCAFRDPAGNMIRFKQATV